MKQREITDSDNKKWTCVQALSFTEKGDTQQISDKLKNDKGELPVVCTPTGGAQSVRLMLSDDWLNSYSDAELLERIRKERE